MKVTAEALTSWSLVAEAARTTVWKGSLPDGKEPSDEFRSAIIRSEHSPLRAIVFKIRMEGIPTCVSVHLVRHHVGVEHYVSTNRPDRNGGNTNVDRNTPVNHLMIINAQELLFMARRRLCGMASPETRTVMRYITDAVAKVDPIVASHMLPMCAYRHMCPEQNGCGLWDRINSEDPK
ncbi:MAG: thymidylate synthase ThyX [Bacteroidales bacterium]|nr:thymidylate synthase ThyX [Bacteroidales bacterium]